MELAARLATHSTEERMFQGTKIQVAFIVCIAHICFWAMSASAEEAIDFNHQIRPILSRHCLACHGPDEGDRQAGLRLDTFEGATEASIEPGDPDGSDLIDRITTDDEDLRMPPADHASSLTVDEIELLRQWIKEGAEYEVHWSFAPIVAPAIPDVKTFASDKNVNVHNSIDNFILEKAIQAELSQSPPSQPAALVRRVSLDLTGLPPIAHDDEVKKSIETFLSEPKQANFEIVVDQLLQSPSYAEHWASMWLDVARYADTCGYAGDERRDIWPWRDWLIRAIDSDKSYKDLSTEMLAGDMLPNATTDQRLATAFHRNTLVNNEGGTNDEEFRTIAVKDRLSTTLNAWMGLTVRCAECHSHKYDPISHVEYYQLLDFFNQTVDADNRDERPKLEVKTMPDPAELAEWNLKIADLERKLADQPKVWNVLRPENMDSRNGTEFELLDDDSILATGPLPGEEEYAFTFEVPAGTTVRAVKLEAIPHVRHDGNVGRAPEGSFILSQIRFAKINLAKVETADEKPADDKQAQSGDENKEPAETIIPFTSAANDFNQVNRHAKNAIKEKVEPGGKQGWAVNHPVNGYRGRHEAIFELKEPMIAKEPTKFTIYLLFDPPWKRLNLGCARISVTDVEDAVVKYDKKVLDQVNREINELIVKRDAPIRVPVMEERSKELLRETFVNLRGNFQSKGEKVSAQFPEAFQTGDNFPLNRIGLTQWMFNEDNPLTARVAVNRYWARLMGIGLVETEEDFGTQGTLPFHPELLDHLATVFREGDWNVRDLLKKIAMSATYQQSQNVNAKELEVDPRNRLLARGPRIRLTAEVVRDQALAVSGLLSKKMYGKPVYPPSPIKRVVNAFTGGMTWQESKGEDRYRRAIYTFLKRSAPHPLFETFDMSSRDTCSMRRLRTNTPLQSFMTLNDITFIEAARALAEQMLTSTDAKEFKDEESLIAYQINWGVKQAFFIESDENQTGVLSKLYRNGVSKFESDLMKAAEMTGLDIEDFDAEKISSEEKTKLAQHASMTVVANVILNLDTFLNN